MAPQRFPRIRPHGAGHAAQQQAALGLTILGIVIGVATVITISSLINGVNNRVAEYRQPVRHQRPLDLPLEQFVGIRPTAEMLARKQLTLDDAEAIPDPPRTWLRWMPRRPIQQLAARRRLCCHRQGQKNSEHHSRMAACPPLPRVKQSHLSRRPPLYPKRGVSRRQRHCSGPRYRGEALRTEDPIGKDVVVNGDVFTVIGVLDKYKQLFGGGSNPNDNVAFPLTTFHKIHPEILDTMHLHQVRRR